VHFSPRRSQFSDPAFQPGPNWTNFLFVWWAECYNSKSIGSIRSFRHWIRKSNRFQFREGKKTCKIEAGKKTVRPSPESMTIVCKTTIHSDRSIFCRSSMPIFAEGRSSYAENSKITSVFVGVPFFAVPSESSVYRGKFARRPSHLAVVNPKNQKQKTQDCRKLVSCVDRAKLAVVVLPEPGGVSVEGRGSHFFERRSKVESAAMVSVNKAKSLLCHQTYLSSLNF